MQHLLYATLLYEYTCVVSVWLNGQPVLVFYPARHLGFFAKKAKYLNVLGIVKYLLHIYYTLLCGCLWNKDKLITDDYCKTAVWLQ